MHDCNLQSATYYTLPAYGQFYSPCGDISLQPVLWMFALFIYCINVDSDSDVEISKAMNKRQ